MRQGQHSHNHNKRSRGRGRGGRPGGGGGGGGGGGNPINRVYESNGPDVKVRGTAQTIAEKYMQLARDAHSSGDTVMAESYNQHAEHYLRILAAAQAYSQQHMGQQQHFRRPMGDDLSEGYEEGGEPESEASAESESPAAVPASEPAPVMPAGAGPDNDARQPFRRSDERQRHQFDRPRNGGDQPRQPRIEDEADGWDGPQPQFLRRPSGPAGQANGGDRQQQQQRRPMRERGQRPREEQSGAGSESSETAPTATDSDSQTAN
jgi:hypothetical protein